MTVEFDSDVWLSERKTELVNSMFMNELGIGDFRNTSVVINFDDLQSNALITRFDKYRKALRSFFGADEVRSLLDYYYLDKDKKPLLNMLKQILKCYGYKLHRVSEYQGNYSGAKLYKSRYTIVKISNIDNETEQSVNGTKDGGPDDHPSDNKGSDVNITESNNEECKSVKN